MDLTGQSTIKHEYDFNESTGITTITFKDASDVSLGTIEIETARYRELMGALRYTAHSYQSIDDPIIQKATTSLNKNAFLAVTEY
jgi:hypothetical protein